MSARSCSGWPVLPALARKNSRQRKKDSVLHKGKLRTDHSMRERDLHHWKFSSSRRSDENRTWSRAACPRYAQLKVACTAFPPSWKQEHRALHFDERFRCLRDSTPMQSSFTRRFRSVGTFPSYLHVRWEAVPAGEASSGPIDSVPVKSVVFLLPGD